MEKKYVVQPYSVEHRDDTIAFRVDLDVAIERAKGLSKDGTIYTVWEFICQTTAMKLIGTAFRGEYTPVEMNEGDTEK